MENGLAAKYLTEVLSSGTPKSYEDASLSTEYLNGLAKEVAYNKLLAEDPPIKDATDQLLVAAQGPKAMAYLSPELTSALRVSNTIKTKDPLRLTGVPTKSELKGALEEKALMEKLKWKLTGNGLKANAWSNSYGGEQ